MTRWKDLLDRFLFFPVDGRAAAWYRIAFALAIPYLFWSIGRAPPSSTTAIEGLYDRFFLRLAYWLVIAGLCVVFGAGWRPRIVGAALLVALLPLAFIPGATRSRQVTMAALTAFCFLRSDAVKIPWRRGAVPSAGPSWPVRLIQIQLTLLYGINAIAKATPAYLSGDVLSGMAVALPNFKAELRGDALQVGFVAVPLVVAGVGSALTEAALAVGFWLGRLKWATAALGLAFHIGLRFVIHIWKLDVASVFLYLAFLLPLIRSRGREVDDLHRNAP